MIKAVIFDFDGVIVDSNRLKYDSFFKALSDVAGHDLEYLQEKFSEIAMLKKTRFEVFDALAVDLEFSKEELKNIKIKYAERYDDLVQEGIKNAGLIARVYETLDEFSKKYSLYINSNTPGQALETTIKNLNISRFFKGVFGKKMVGMDALPNSKKLNLESIMSSEKLSGNEVVFVGDGDEDLKAATQCSCHFIGVPNKINGWYVVSTFQTLNNFATLPSLISQFE